MPYMPAVIVKPETVSGIRTYQITLVLDIIFNGEFLPDRVLAFYSFGYRAAHRFQTVALHGQGPRARAPESFWRGFFTGARRADRKT